MGVYRTISLFIIILTLPVLSAGEFGRIPIKYYIPEADSEHSERETGCWMPEHNGTLITNDTIGRVEVHIRCKSGNDVDTNITIRKYSTCPVSADLNRSYERCYRIESEKDIKGNTSYILIKFYYNEREVNETTIELYWFNETAESWHIVNTSLSFVYGTEKNTTQDYILTNNSHLSWYALAGDSVVTTTPEVTAPSTGGGGGIGRLPRINLTAEVVNDTHVGLTLTTTERSSYSVTVTWYYYDDFGDLLLSGSRHMSIPRLNYSTGLYEKTIVIYIERPEDARKLVAEVKYSGRIVDSVEFELLNVWESIKERIEDFIRTLLSNQTETNLTIRKPPVEYNFTVNETPVTLTLPGIDVNITKSDKINKTLSKFIRLFSKPDDLKGWLKYVAVVLFIIGLLLRRVRYG